VGAAVEMAEKFLTEPILVNVITLPPWRSGSFQRATNKERHTEYAHEAMAPDKGVVPKSDQMPAGS
jgi:hypothetical protein